MRVHYIKPCVVNGNKRPMLIMQPESERDRDTLEKIVKSDMNAGFGRNAVSGNLEHVDLFIGDKNGCDT